MLQTDICLNMRLEYILNDIKQNHEIRCAETELEKVESEIRKCKIDILKNGIRKDKINLLIEERLQDLENKEREYDCKKNEID